MNYRHAFHAGSHIDVFKHAVLALLVLHVRKKPKPFVVLDTHAGLGAYDLRSDEAQRTGEAAEGIGVVLNANLPTAAPYLDIIRAMNPDGMLTAYPGSPAIVASLLRSEDRLIACELHPEDVQTLRAEFRHDARIGIHHRDGYEALLAFIPPPERRGLVFIDPPFESLDEAARLGDRLVAAIRKWPTGIYAAWYPVKKRSTLAPLFERLEGISIDKAITVEFVRHPEDGVRLAGSGLVIVNPPWGIEDDLTRLVDELRVAFAAPEQTTPIRRLEPARRPNGYPNVVRSQSR